MNQNDKLKIVDALIDIKVALGLYNNSLNNDHNSVDAEYDVLKKAFIGTVDIAEVIRNN